MELRRPSDPLYEAAWPVMRRMESNAWWSTGGGWVRLIGARRSRPL